MVASAPLHVVNIGSDNVSKSPGDRPGMSFSSSPLSLSWLGWWSLSICCLVWTDLLLSWINLGTDSWVSAARTSHGSKFLCSTLNLPGCPSGLTLYMGRFLLCSITTCICCSQYHQCFPGPPRSDKFQTNNLSPGCNLENRTLQSYCLLPSVADLEVFFRANEYASFIAIFHLSAYSAWVTLASSGERPNIRSTGRRGDLPYSK